MLFKYNVSSLRLLSFTRPKFLLPKPSSSALYSRCVLSLGFDSDFIVDYAGLANVESLRSDIVFLLLISTSLISKIIIESHDSINFIYEYKYILIIINIIKFKILK